MFYFVMQLLQTSKETLAKISVFYNIQTSKHYRIDSFVGILNS